MAIGGNAFQECTSLESVSLGTSFKTAQNIYLDTNAFTGVTTTNIDLTLGYNVLPERDGNF